MELSEQEIRPVPISAHESGHYVLAHEYGLNPVPYLADPGHGTVVADGTSNPIVSAAIGWGGIAGECLLKSKITYRPRPVIPLTGNNLDVWLSEIEVDCFSENDWELVNRAPFRVGLESAFTVLSQRRADLIRTAVFLENFFAKNISAGSNPVAADALESFAIGVEAYGDMGERFLNGHRGRELIVDAIKGSRIFSERLERRQEIDRVLCMAKSRTDLADERARLALMRAAETQKG